ncbi:hypothetical protein PFISCL1PPCAC_18145, partial [Pristionchus fissidentatus]
IFQLVLIQKSDSEAFNDATEVEQIVVNLVAKVAYNEQDYINLVPDGVLLQISNSIGLVKGVRRHATVPLVHTCRRWKILLSD